MKINILVDYTPAQRSGGMGQVAIQLQQALAQLGADVHVFTPGIFGKLDGDIINLQSFWFPMVSTEAKIVTSLHTNLMEELRGSALNYRQLTFRIRHKINQYAHRKSAITTFLTKEVATQYGVPTGHVLPNGFSPTEHRFPQTRSRLALWVGTSAHRKGFTALPKIACELHTRGEPLTVLGVKYFPGGTGMGYVSHDELLQQLASHKVLVSTATYEGQPLTVMEAMSLGTVPLLSDIPAHRNLLSPDLQASLLFSEHDFSEKLSHILQNWDLLHHRILACARTFPSWNSIAAEYLKLLKSL